MLGSNRTDVTQEEMIIILDKFDGSIEYVYKSDMIIRLLEDSDMLTNKKPSITDLSFSGNYYIPSKIYEHVSDVLNKIPDSLHRLEKTEARNKLLGIKDASETILINTIKEVNNTITCVEDISYTSLRYFKFYFECSIYHTCEIDVVIKGKEFIVVYMSFITDEYNWNIVEHTINSGNMMGYLLPQYNLSEVIKSCARSDEIKELEKAKVVVPSLEQNSISVRGSDDIPVTYLISSNGAEKLPHLGGTWTSLEKKLGISALGLSKLSKQYKAGVKLAKLIKDGIKEQNKGNGIRKLFKRG